MATALGVPESEKDRKAAASNSKREVYWGVAGAALAGLIALAAGVLTASITGADQAEQSQVDFARSERIDAYESFSEAEAALAQELVAALGIAGSATREGTVRRPDVDTMRDVVMRLRASSTALQSSQLSLNFVATCEVRNAAKRVVNAYQYAIQDFELLQLWLADPVEGESYGDRFYFLFLSDSVQDLAGETVRADFEGLIRQELGFDPPSAIPQRMIDPEAPLNDGIESC